MVVAIGDHSEVDIDQVLTYLVLTQILTYVSTQVGNLQPRPPPPPHTYLTQIMFKESNLEITVFP
jgi:hypothetical protein